MADFGRRTVHRGRHIRIDFQPDRRGIAALAVGPEITALVRLVAESKAKPYAVSISPVGDHADGDETPGRYRNSWEVHDLKVVEGGDGYPMLRSAARLVNTAAHATWVEVGTKWTKGVGHHVLRRTLEYLDATSGN